MTKEELAAKLDGRQYRNEIDKATESAAKESGLVVVFGHSDDNVEWRGAAYEEFSAYGGTTIPVTRDGILVNKCGSDDECPYFEALAEKAQKITALWCDEKDGPMWTFKTNIPHATFMIYIDEDTFCRGIVFALIDVEQR